jgi:peptide/nickel transport system permease protein
MFGTQAVNIRPEDRAKIEAELGLSDPLVVQYGNWLKDIGTGKLGNSFRRADTVLGLIKARGPLTIEIAVISILLSWMIGLPVGIISALKQNSLIDYCSRVFRFSSCRSPAFGSPRSSFWDCCSSGAMVRPLAS